jgi:hypothetical protein
MADTLDFITPDNKIVKRSADPASIKDAQDIGYKIATPEALEEMRKQIQYGEGAGNAAKTFLQGAGEGATFGATTPLAVKLGILSPEAAQERPERNPVAYGSGQVAGIVGSDALMPEVGAVGAVRRGSQAIARGAAEALPDAGKVLNYAKSVGQEALGSGIEGAAYGLGNSVAEGDLGDPKLNAEHIMANAGSGALLGGIFGTGAGVLKGFLPETTKTAQELLGKDLTTPEMAAQHADVQGLLDVGLQDPNLPEAWRSPITATQDALKPQEFAANQHDVLSAARDQLAALPTDVLPEYADAKQHMVDHITQHLGNGDVWGDETAALQVPTGDTGRKLLTKLAASSFGVNEEAIEARLANPQGFANAPTPFEFVEKMKQSFQEAKQSLSDDSTASLKMVQDANVHVPQEKILNPIEAAANTLREGKTTALRPQAEATANMLDRLAANVTAHAEDGQLNLTTAWTLKKSLQDDISGLMKNGEKHTAGAIIEMRNSINQLIKDAVPGYTEHMEQLAADAKSFDGVAKKLSTDNGLAAFSKRVGRGEETFEKQALRKFDAQFGTDFTNEARMVWAKDQFTKASTQGSRKTNMFWSIGAGLGSAFGHAGAMVGGGLGAQVGAFLDQQGGKALNTIMSNAEKLQQIERLVNQSTNALNKAVKGVLTKTGPATAILGTNQTHEEHKQSAEKLRLLASNIEAMSDHVGQFSAQVYGAAPQTSSAIAGVSTAALGFLASKLPPARQESLFNKPMEYTPAELDKFGRYVDVVKNPMKVLDSISTGHPSKEGVETLQAVYPTLYGQMQTRMLHELTNMKNPADLPYKTRLGVSQFMGTPLDKSLAQPALAANYQSYLQDQAQQAQHQQTGVRANAKLTQGTRLSTPFDAPGRGQK